MQPKTRDDIFWHQLARALGPAPRDPAEAIKDARRERNTAAMRRYRAEQRAAMGLPPARVRRTPALATL